MNDSVERSLVQRTQALGITLNAIADWIGEAGAGVPEPDAALGELINDLLARVRKLQEEPTLLAVVFLGGTGVGKSTLLNALAGAQIADSSLVRPTTTQPAAYVHRDVAAERLHPLLAGCRLVHHDRESLRHKVLIDTPDIDGNVIEHRERLRDLMPAADAVLYVGSQEKYHDREGWKLLQENKDARGFAFVLNKWDRCLGLVGDRSGVSPADDFRKTLREAGFENPLVFRTCARQRTGKTSEAGTPAIDDDFDALMEWLDRGLDEAAVRAIKSRGIAGQLDELVERLREVIPAELGPAAQRLKEDWNNAIQEAVREEATAFVRAADRHAPSFEQHLRSLGRENFRGPFAYYMGVVDWLARPKLTAALPTIPARKTAMEELADWTFGSIPDETKRALHDSLHHRLLSIADQRRFPLAALERLLPADREKWLSNEILLNAARDEVLSMERDYTEPSLGRAGLQRLTTLACNWLPWGAMVFLALLFLVNAFRGNLWGIGDFIGAFFFMTLIFVALHFMVSKLFPIDWEGLRKKMQRDLEQRLFVEVSGAYFKALDDLVGQTRHRREKILPAIDLCDNLAKELHRASSADRSMSMFARPQA